MNPLWWMWITRAGNTKPGFEVDEDQVLKNRLALLIGTVIIAALMYSIKDSLIVWIACPLSFFLLIWGVIMWSIKKHNDKDRYG